MIDVPPVSYLNLQVIHDLVTNLQDANKTRISKVASMRKKEELDDIKKLAELEKRVQAAESNRQAQLSVKSSTAIKKRQLSPRLSPTSKVEIEAKINQAAQRRELYLVGRRISDPPSIIWSSYYNICPLTIAQTDKPSREGKGQGKDNSIQREAQPRTVLGSVTN